jgi:hypothetical protein
MGHLAANPRSKFYDTNGAVLAGGKLYTYQAGTTTPLATYTDQTEGTANANPVILDANGEALVWIGSNSYKFVLKDSSDVTLYTWDNIAAVDNGSVTAIKIVDGTITTAKFADGSVTTAKLADGNVTTAKIADLGVTTGKIANLNVTTGTIADSAVTTAKIADANVTTAKILDANVTTAKIADANVTRAKLVAVGQQVSSSCGAATRNVNSYADVTNLTVTITTTGRPVMVFLIPDGAAAASCGDTVGSGSIQILRDSTSIGVFTIASSGTTNHSVGEILSFDVVAAGTYVYKVQFKSAGGGGGNVVAISNAKLVAYEL